MQSRYQVVREPRFCNAKRLLRFSRVFFSDLVYYLIALEMVYMVVLIHGVTP